MNEKTESEAGLCVCLTCCEQLNLSEARLHHGHGHDVQGLPSSPMKKRTTREAAMITEKLIPTPSALREARLCDVGVSGEDGFDGRFAIRMRFDVPGSASAEGTDCGFIIGINAGESIEAVANRLQMSAASMLKSVRASGELRGLTVSADFATRDIDIRWPVGANGRPMEQCGVRGMFVEGGTEHEHGRREDFGGTP